MDSSHKEINAGLAQLEEFVEDVKALAQKCEESGQPFPSTTSIRLIGLLTTVCRGQNKLIFDLRDRVTELEKRL